MKKVEVELNKLMKAPIDEKNVLADALFDLMFDNSLYIWEGCQAVGFVNNLATIASYHDNILVVKIIPNNTSQEEKCGWYIAVVNAITGLESDSIKTFKYASLLNEDENIIYTYVVVCGVIEFQFHFNKE